MKADGLAVGKGTVVPASRDEAIDALRSTAASTARWARPAARVVIEDKLDGREV